MIGKKPIQGFLVVREFRGSKLYLHSDRQCPGKGMHWIAERSKAHVFTDAQEALALKDRGSREWGASCVVVDTSAEAHIVERTS